MKKTINFLALIFMISILRIDCAYASIGCSQVSVGLLAEALVSGFKLDSPAAWAKRYAENERPYRHDLLKKIGNFSIVNPQPEFAPGYMYVQLRFKDEGVISGVVFCSAGKDLRVVAGSFSFPALGDYGDLAKWNFPTEQPWP